jgi:peptidyl-prolyl cis-trans isomerase D
MRKNAGSWIIKVLFIIIIIVFIGFYGFNRSQKDSYEFIAKVGDKKISISEYREAYKNAIQFYRNFYKNNFTEEMIEKMALKQKVLDDLIDREILLQEAEKLNIQVTQEEVRKSIVSTPVFQENGVFNSNLYKRALSFYGVSAGNFEKSKEKELLIKIIENMVNNSVKTSEKELKDLYRLQNEKVKIDYVNFTPDIIKEDIKISEKDITDYYEKNKENLRVPEKVKVKYLIFEPKEFEKKADVSDKEIKEYYDLDKEQYFEPKKIKARHIILKVAENLPPEKEEEIKTKAMNILQRLKNGEKFEELAKMFSEDNSTAKKGGELGYFKKGDMVKPFEEAAFSLKPGEISSIVKTQFGFHIIKVEDVKDERTKPLEEVKEDIKKDIISEKAQQMVSIEAKKAFNRLFKSKDIEEYSKKNDIKLLETDYFAFGKGPEDQQGKETFSKEAFMLSPGELAPVFAIDQKYFLIKLIDKKESTIPSIEEAKGEIEKEVKKIKRLEMTKAKADKELSQLIEGKEKFDDLKKKYGLEIKETECNRRGDYIFGIGNSKELKESVFALEKTMSFSSKTFQTDKGIFLVRLKERQTISDADFEKDKDKIAQLLIQNKKKESFDLYLQNLKAKTEIWVDDRLLSSG